MKKKMFRERYSQLIEDGKERIRIGQEIIERTKKIAHPKIAEELLKEEVEESKPKKRGRKKSVKSDK